MNDYDLMLGLGGPGMVYMAWFFYMLFIAAFTVGAIYLWNLYIKKEKE